MKTTGEILKGYRAQKPITAKDLADKIGVSQTFYTKIENNQSKVSEKVLEVLRVLLSKEEYSDLLEYEDFRSTPDFVRKEINVLHKDEIREKRRVVIEVGEIPYYPDLKASAGIGCFNEDIGVEEYIEVPANYAKAGNVAIKISGDSMYPEVQDGDIAVVNTCDIEFVRNKIVVVNYKDEIYIKKIIEGNGKFYLQSTNPFYKPIEIDEEDEFSVIGRVVFLERLYD